MPLMSLQLLRLNFVHILFCKTAQTCLDWISKYSKPLRCGYGSKFRWVVLMEAGLLPYSNLLQFLRARLPSLSSKILKANSTLNFSITLSLICLPGSLVFMFFANCQLYEGNRLRWPLFSCIGGGAGWGGQHMWSSHISDFSLVSFVELNPSKICWNMLLYF